MKKIFSLIVACAALFAACETDPTGEGTNNGGNNNGGENNNDGKKTELAAPAIEIKDVTSTSFTVTWAAVENAESYMVTVGDAQPVTITETSYKVENLNAGTYSGAVIAVAAKDSNYTNSKASAFSQDVTGLTPEECDWAVCEVSLPTEEDGTQYGHYPFMHIYHSFQGKGIVEIRNGAFDAETYGKTPVADLAKECSALDAETIAMANDKGVTVVFSGVTAETEYRVVAVVTNEAGLTVIFEDTITTTEAQPHPAMEAFVGTWTVTTEKAMVIPMADEEPIRVDAQSMSATITVTPALDFNYQAVYVAGLSSLDPETPALGLVTYDEDGVEILYIMNEQMVGISEDKTYYIGWGTLGEVKLPTAKEGDAPTYTLVGGEYPAFTIKNGVGTGIVGELNGGGTFEALAMDVFAYDGDINMVGWFYGGESGNEDAVLMAGTQTWTRASEETPEEETPATFSAKFNNRKMTSVVMPSYVAL